MRIKRMDLELLVQYVEDLYIFTKKIVLSNCPLGVEWVDKDSIAVLCKERSNNRYKEFVFYDTKRKPDYNDGSLPIYNLSKLVKRRELRPLTKEEKYEILSRYKKKMSGKIDTIKNGI